MQADAYEDEHETLQLENQKIKNQNVYLETHMQDVRLKNEKDNRLLSSSFYHLGQIQVKNDRVGAKAAKDRFYGADMEADWLDSQKDNCYAHSYEMILRHP